MPAQAILEDPSLKNLTNSNFGKPPEHHNELLEELGAPHISSFNYMLDKGLDEAVADLYTVSLKLPSDEQITLKIEDASIGLPTIPAGTIGVKNTHVFPSECRQRAYTYKARMVINVAWSINGRPQPSFEKDVGEVPIMLRSSHCRLANMRPADLVANGEHEEEWGGYFIIKGHERLVRMLLMTRRNYPISIKRSSWKSRGSLFSDIGILLRCVKHDQTAANNVLHYITDGTAKLMFSHRKFLYYAPLVLILKCLLNCSDQYIYQKLVRGFEKDMYYCGRVQNMLRLIHEENLHTHEDCKKYLGAMFKVKLPDLANATNEEVSEFILRQCVLIHLDKDEDKFNMLVFMTQKLFCLAQNGCKIEGVDSVMMQELLLGGHLYLQVLKEKLQNWLFGLKANILKRARRMNYSLSAAEIQQATRQTGGFENIMETFLATGNISSNTGLGLMQDKGLTIVAENINRMRYMSHFRAVHRGAFFQEMRTTEARQLLPDAWGFICPVHTPDGEPCGLLNHLTMNCKVTDVPDTKLLANVPTVLTNLGMTPLDTSSVHDVNKCYTVQLDGCILGYISTAIANRLVDKLRMKKIKGIEVPSTLEIVLVPRKNVPGQFPGLYLFTGPARMMRPLVNLAAKQIELIGTFEQVYMNVCIVPEEAYAGITTHMELSKTAFMSNLAHLIPMPDCNQSPRNMYQCQMGKQTMGTPCHTWTTQAETKMYRLQTPTSPLFRPVHHDNVNLDNFAMGTNAIVAVISYTGYDMEDAMIINKSSYERGFAHGCIYKSEFIELKHATSYFCRNPQLPSLADKLDTDGLPQPGTKLTYEDPLYCYFDADESRYFVVKYKGKEEAVVDNVRLCGSFNTRAPKIACIVFRITRNPSVGDKFASRAGQKGICSQKWPAEDLPFTETGLVPDIVFNPHGFPSRMTIAMMIEIMAGKSAALHGLVHDATPFRFNEDDTAIDYFGKLLEAGGYNYFGTETMYSGIDGREMTAQIFFGIVHYQRLRHMVSDKWQVRSTGPIDVLTRQPIKGRKRGGGVRFGEMERDSLISHGASFLLQDRLFHCSDKTTALVCTSCGTLLGPVTLVTRVSDKMHLSETKETCRLCGHGNNISQVELPYIFKYLVTQLASVNINVKLDCKKK